MHDKADQAKKMMTRRSFLTVLLGSAAGLAAVACSQGQPATPAATAKPAATTAPAATSAPAAATAAKPAATAAAAATKAPASLKGVTLNFLTWANFVPASDDVLKQQTEEWNKQTGATVRIEIINQNDLQAKSTAAVESGSGPDIIMMRHNWPHLYETKLADVSDVAEKLGSDFGGYYDDEVANNKVKGVWRAVPQNVLPTAPVYRADILKEVTGSDKFPETFDDLAKVSAEIKKAKGMAYGQAFGHAINDGNTGAYSDMWAFGGHEVEKDGKTVAIASPETLASIQWHVDTWKSAFDESGLGWDDSSNNRAFLAGEIWGTVNGASIYLAALKDGNEMHKAMLHAPNPKGPAGDIVHYHVTNELAILGYCKNIDAAKEYIRYLMAQEQYTKWLGSTKGFHTGPTKAWEKDPLWDQDPKMELFRDIGKYGRQPGYPAAPSKSASEALSKFIVIDMYAQAINGSMNPQQAMDWAAAEFKKIYPA